MKSLAWHLIVLTLAIAAVFSRVAWVEAAHLVAVVVDFLVHTTREAYPWWGLVLLTVRKHRRRLLLVLLLVLSLAVALDLLN